MSAQPHHIEHRHLNLLLKEVLAKDDEANLIARYKDRRMLLWQAVLSIVQRLD
jgi:hypothetical protein